jgi:flavodoxin
MNSIIIYASRYGNTKQVADAIAEGLRAQGAVHLLAMDEVTAIPSEGIDLIVIGGPTEVHGMTEPVARFFDRMGVRSFQGRAVAIFDTRYRWPRWLTGSASATMTRRLRRMGARVIALPESFFVVDTANAPTPGDPLLEPGELERATAWAALLADAAHRRAPVALNQAG